MHQRVCEVVVDVEEHPDGRPGTLTRCAAEATFVVSGRGVCQNHRIEVGLRDDIAAHPDQT